MADKGVRINILGDSSGFEGAVDKAARAAQQGGDKMDRAMSGAGKSTFSLTGAMNDLGLSGVPVLGQAAGAAEYVESALGTMGVTAGTAALGVTAGVAGIALAVGGLTYLAYQLGAEFDEAYDKIQIGTGATGDRLASLQESFRGVVADVPDSFENVAEIVSQLGSRMNLSEGDTERLTEQLSNLSRMTGGDVAATTSAAIDLFYRWGIPTDQQSLLLDKLFVASQKSGAGVADLAANVAASSASLMEMGFSVDSATAMLAGLERVGFSTDKMVTGLNKAYLKLAKGADDESESATGGANRAASAARSRAAAMRGVRDAQERLADATRRLGEAQADYNQVLTVDIERERAAGRDRLAEATDRIAEAQQRVIDAKKRLDELLKGPSERDVEKLRIRQKEAALAIARAEEKHAAAVAALNKARDTGDSAAIVSAQNEVAQAALDVRQAQLAAADASDELKAAMNPGASKEAADARRQVADAEKDVVSAQKDAMRTAAELNERLGPNMDGSVLLAEAAKRLADAQRGVSQAQQGVADAQQRVADSGSAAAGGMKQVNDIGPKTKEVLKALGLEGASVEEQFQGLIEWMSTTPDKLGAVSVAAELFGSRSAPELVEGLRQSKAATDDVRKSMDKARGSINDTAADTNDGAEDFRIAMNRMKLAAEPIGDAVFGFLADRANELAFAIGLLPWAWETAKNTFFTIAVQVGAIFSGIGNTIGTVADWVGRVWDSAFSAVKGAINGIIGAWNALDLEIGPWKIPDWVPWPLGGKTFHIRDMFPDIPKLAEGGIVRNRPGGILANIGEAGRDEAIVPLPRGGDLSSLMGSGDTYISVTGMIGTPAELERMLVEVLRRAQRKGHARGLLLP